MWTTLFSISRIVGPTSGSLVFFIWIFFLLGELEAAAAAALGSFVEGTLLYASTCLADSGALLGEEVIGRDDADGPAL